MSAFINIAADSDKPIYIDVENVTSLRMFPDEDTLEIYDKNGLVLLQTECYSHGIDPDIIAGKMADRGISLVPFSNKPEGQPPVLYYISPSAVTFLSTTEVGKDGKIGVIAGVKGMCRMESYTVRPEELQALLDAAQATGKIFDEYKKDEASARWFSPDKLYIDLKAVTRVQDDGYQVMVAFEDSGAALDVQTGRNRDEIAQRLYQENPDDYPFGIGGAFGDTDVLINQKRRDFAQKLGKSNDGLTAVPDAQTFLYLRREDIAHVGFYDSEDTGHLLVLNIKRTIKNSFPSQYVLRYHSKESRAKAVQALTAKTVSKARPGKPRPGSFKF